MARIKDNNPIKRFDKISIGLASPEAIWENQEERFLNLKLLIIEPTNQSEMVFFVSEYSVL